MSISLSKKSDVGLFFVDHVDLAQFQSEQSNQIRQRICTNLALSVFNSVLKCVIQSINTKGRHKPDSNPQETQSIDQTGQMMSYKLKD